MICLLWCYWSMCWEDVGKCGMMQECFCAIMISSTAAPLWSSACLWRRSCYTACSTSAARWRWRIVKYNDPYMLSTCFQHAFNMLSTCFQHFSTLTLLRCCRCQIRKRLDKLDGRVLARLWKPSGPVLGTALDAIKCMHMPTTKWFGQTCTLCRHSSICFMCSNAFLNCGCQTNLDQLHCYMMLQDITVAGQWWLGVLQVLSWHGQLHLARIELVLAGSPDLAHGGWSRANSEPMEGLCTRLRQRPKALVCTNPTNMKKQIGKQY